MGDNPAKYRGMRNPVEQVSWDDCQKYIKRLGQLLPSHRFRLPTEAEWEYACRAGTKTRFSFGNSDSDLGNYAWHRPKSGMRPYAVGTKRPNPWGLYDMHGNIGEWCSDKYGKYEFPMEGVVSDPTGSGSGEFRVVRGGFYRGAAGFCRSAARSRASPDIRGTNLGFRVVLGLN
jgi:formylglycine-generating enzyme required for sulfatase activity